MRQKWFLVVSAAYILIGLVILVRAGVAHVVLMAVLGLVFLALGAVRIRDYVRWRRTTSDL